MLTFHFKMYTYKGRNDLYFYVNSTKRRREKDVKETREKGGSAIG